MYIETMEFHIARVARGVAVVSMLAVVLSGCAMGNRMKMAESHQKQGRSEVALQQYLEIADDYPDESKPLRRATSLGKALIDSSQQRSRQFMDSASYLEAILELEEAMRIAADLEKHGVKVPLALDGIIREIYARYENQIHTLCGKDSSYYSEFEIEAILAKLYERRIAAIQLNMAAPPDRIMVLLDQWKRHTQYRTFTRKVAEGQRSSAIEYAIRTRLALVASYKDSVAKEANIQHALDEASLGEYAKGGNHQKVVELYEQTVNPRHQLYNRYFNTIAPITTYSLYTDSKLIVNTEYAEQHYQQALQADSMGRSIRAIEHYKKTNQFIPGYKDSEERMGKSQAMAKLGIGVASLSDDGNCGGLAANVYSSIFAAPRKGEYVEFNDPASGSKWIVSGKVESCHAEESIVPTRSVQAFIISETNSLETRTQEEYSEKHKQMVTTECHVSVTRYHGSPVYIRMYKGVKRLRVVLTLKIIEAETNKLVANEKLETSILDSVSYADCGGCEVGRLASSIPDDNVPSECEGFWGTLLNGVIHSVFSSSSSPVHSSHFEKRRTFNSTFDMQQNASDNIAKSVGKVLDKKIHAYIESLK